MNTNNPLDLIKKPRDINSGLYTSKYDPEYAIKLIELMADGLTLTAACGELRIAKQTVYNWQNQHPEFKEACEIALMARQALLERKFLDTKLASDVTKYIFALKTAKTSNDWKETNSVELSGPNGDPIKSEISVVEYVIVDREKNSDSEK